MTGTSRSRVRRTLPSLPPQRSAWTVAKMPTVLRGSRLTQHTGDGGEEQALSHACGLGCADGSLQPELVVRFSVVWHSAVLQDSTVAVMPQGKRCRFPRCVVQKLRITLKTVNFHSY